MVRIDVLVTKTELEVVFGMVDVQKIGVEGSIWMEPYVKNVWIVSFLNTPEPL